MITEIPKPPCSLILCLCLLLKTSLGPPTLRIMFSDLPHFHLREGPTKTPAKADALLSYTITAIPIVFII